VCPLFAAMSAGKARLVFIFLLGSESQPECEQPLPQDHLLDYSQQGEFSAQLQPTQLIGYQNIQCEPFTC